MGQNPRMTLSLISELKQREEQKFHERMDFLNRFEEIQAQASALGYRLTLEEDNQESGYFVEVPLYPQGLPKKAQLRMENDQMKFKNVAEAIAYALDLVPADFTTADVLGQIQKVAPAFYNERDLSSFSHGLKRLTEAGVIKMTVRGAGKKSSQYVKTPENQTLVESKSLY